MQVREYAEDFDACLVVFDSNVPKFFAAAERGQFATFLERMPGRYFVLEEQGKIVGCGGYARNGDSSASLCWGMVRRDRHGNGFGRLLLEERLRHIREDGAFNSVIMNTSQHTVGFFEKFGFVPERVIPDGYAPGLHRYELRLTLRSAAGAA
jgi:ribosomal protein S18 acetylase RimI-like enzyme